MDDKTQGDGKIEAGSEVQVLTVREDPRTSDEALPLQKFQASSEFTTKAKTALQAKLLESERDCTGATTDEDNVKRTPKSHKTECRLHHRSRGHVNKVHQLPLVQHSRRPHHRHSTATTQQHRHDSATTTTQQRHSSATIVPPWLDYSCRIRAHI